MIYRICFGFVHWLTYCARKALPLAPGRLFVLSDYVPAQLHLVSQNEVGRLLHALDEGGKRSEDSGRG